ncbi:MAG: DUF5362 domain-containing protein [Candidatus Kapabacteria bacterium]|nr:DUF5362 domain-containing protein [Candidatus Kapabacteria bacterium]
MDDFTTSAVSYDNSDPRFIEMVKKMASDMKFNGIFCIIYGALTCLSIVGAVIGVPLIFAGLRLNESSDLFKAYLNTGDFISLSNALERQGRYFFINKVLIIIALVLLALYIVLIIVLISSGLFLGSRGFDFN